MIIVRLAGGLGNQIFQVGAGLLLAKRSGHRSIIIDSSSLEDYATKRENALIDIFDFKKSGIQIKFKSFFLSRFRIPRFLPLKLPNYPFVNDINFHYILQEPNKYFCYWMDIFRNV